MIKVTNLSFSYPEKKVFHNVNLRVYKGEFISIIGPSGCGKTTLLRILANIYHEYGGEISIDGISPSEYRRQQKYAYFFQEPNLFPWRTVEENIRLPLEILHKVDPKKIDKTLALVQLEPYRHFYPESISGGMKQKTALARGLVFDPELLLMDEPFASLDEMTRESLTEELLTLWSQKKQTILFVTHSITEAVFLADRVAIFNQQGNIKKITSIKLSRPRTKEIRMTKEFFDYCNQLRKEINS